MIDLLQRRCTQWIVLISLLICCTYQSIRCYSGSNNCFSCTDRWICGTCYPGYSLVQGALSRYCTQCSDQRCLSCPTNIYICTQCAQSYYLDSGNCYPCSMGACDICDASSCYQCLPEYRYLNPLNCQRCSNSNCEVCDTGSNICTFCRPPYGVSGNTCARCNDFYCWACQTDYTVCNYCSNSYGINSATGLCQLCAVTNCVLCNSNSTYCTRCVSGYGQISGQCLSCVRDRCLTCSTYDYNNCYSCIDGFGASYGSCIGCPVNCQQCSFNASECTACDDGYTVVNGVCQPCNSPCQTCNGINYCLTCTGAQYAWSGNCYPCNSPCQTCNTINYCLTCTGAQYAWSGNCYNCMTLCLRCTTGSTCQLCVPGYFANSSNLCQICPSNCTECFYDFNYTTINCTVCKSQFLLSTNPAFNCLQVCGDLVAFQTPCDYELKIQYDGCTDICEVEYGFICNKTNQTSVCSYQNQTILEIVSIVQSIDSNSFTMRVSVWPPLYVFRTSDLKSVFRIVNPIFTITSVQFDYATSEFIFKVDFSSTCWNCEIVVEFVPDPTVDQRYFASVNSQASVFAQLYYYPNLGMSMDQYVPYFCYGTVGIGMLAALLGIFAKRLPGLESIITGQIAFISLIWINTYLLRPFSKALPLQYILGYHINITSTSNSTARLLLLRQNPHYQEFPHYAQFGFDQKNLANNVNIMLAFQAIAFLSSVITSIIFGYFNRKFEDLKKKKDDQGMQILRPKHTKTLTAKEISFQCLMYFGMLNLVGFTAFAVLFFKNNNQYTNNIINLIFLALGLLLYLCTYLLFILTPDPFDYFRYSFKQSTLAMAYYFLYSLAIISTILLLELLSQPWPALIPFGCLFIFTLVYQPYRYMRDNIRASFNMLVILGFLSLRVLIKYNYQKPEEISDNAFILYLIDLILLLICVIIGLVFVIYQIITYFLKQNQEKNEKYQVMCELQKMNVKKKFGQNQIDDKQDNVFGQLLSEKTNILQFSNMISGMKDNKIKYFPQSDNQYNNIKNIRKEMEKEKMQNNYNSTKTQDLKNAEEKIHMNQLRQKIEIQEEGLLLNQKKDQNRKLLYAMQVIKQQNTWINLKHARDYTLQKIREGVKQQFISKYDQI